MTIPRRPTSLGPASRLAITAAVVALGLAVRALGIAWAGFAGRAGLGLAVVMLGAWAILAGFVLWFAWRPARRPTIVRVEGEVLSVTPARRRADDFGTPVRRG